jgi:hypothetical protein
MGFGGFVLAAAIVPLNPYNGWLNADRPVRRHGAELYV